MKKAFIVAIILAICLVWTIAFATTPTSLCDHPDRKSETMLVMRIYSANDDGTHTVHDEYRLTWYCTICGEELSRRIIPEEYTEEHSFKGKICEFCGAEKPAADEEPTLPDDEEHIEQIDEDAADPADLPHGFQNDQQYTLAEAITILSEDIPNVEMVGLNQFLTDSEIEAFLSLPAPDRFAVFLNVTGITTVEVDGDAEVVYNTILARVAGMGDRIRSAFMDTVSQLVPVRVVGTGDAYDIYFSFQIAYDSESVYYEEELSFRLENDVWMLDSIRPVVVETAGDDEG